MIIHIFINQAGIQAAVTQQLISETNFDNLEEWKKFMGVILE